MSNALIKVAADAVIHFLASQGTRALHNYPGGTIAPLLDACNRFGIKVYTSRHEQGAGYAALAQAKLTGLPGVVAVTSGPGVTNVLTPVADAFFDGIPLLVFTGQVGTSDLTGGKPVRQSGFQEVDTPALMKSITKAQFQPKSVSELIDVLPKAWNIACDGRMGPVSLDLPMDVQRAVFDGIIAPLKPAVSDPIYIQDFISELLSAIQLASQPVIICGNGMANAEHANLLKVIRQIWPAPVSHSLLGVGTLDTEDVGCLGFHGHTGSQLAGNAIAQADLLLVLGSRLDVRQTGTLKAQFAKNARIFRVDFDESELTYSRIAHHHSVCSPLKPVLQALMEGLTVSSVVNLFSWQQQINEWRKSLPWPYANYPGAAPKAVLEYLSDKFPENTIVTTGVGAHQHWVARHFRFALPQRRLMTSAGHGTMGYDLPSAIGAAIHSPQSTVLCVAGDGSFQMNIQELGMIKELGLALKILVLDNHRLGLVSQFQLMNWETDIACGNKQSPDFTCIAKGYGIAALHCGPDDNLIPILDEFISTNEPVLLHLEIDSRHDVLPMLLGGQTTDKMWPYFDMQGNPSKKVDYE
ncbi:MAG: thiamine pyrophosphate-binding protein [Paraglaciecola sp.]|uniref:thiamine pyrophosphate-binding protein n=1 Tax=Paraglaciecola sp. TaxID=1920173 RepID=UPI00273F92D0|nr:thiamine pyrophosphate-binding protein [Paraglaciecola sp.]MDP5030994.1 thiamine pyrophosphate-binding protein [Paraglaciecola sp.]MDP5132743.1 thiamine pyrophosphate-binding protein [Paraglaciecola sp.]